MMAAQPCRSGSSGSGYWGKNLLRTFGKLPSARVAEICDLDPKLLEAAKKDHPAARTGSDLDAMLGARRRRRDPRRHAAVAPPRDGAGRAPRRQARLGGEAARAHGRRGARAGRRRPRDAKKTLFVDETFLYDPLVREMKRVIDEGALGDVFHLSFERLGMGRIRRDSNVWWNSAPHDLSILFYLVPRPVKAVQLYLHTYLQPGVADMAVCDLELEGGVSAHVYLSWLHPEKTATRDRRRARAHARLRGPLREARASRSSTTRSIRPAPRRLARQRAHRADHEVRGPEARRARSAPSRSPAPPSTSSRASSPDREPLTSGARSLRVVETLETADRTAVRSGKLV